LRWDLTSERKSTREKGEVRVRMVLPLSVGVVADWEVGSSVTTERSSRMMRKGVGFGQVWMSLAKWKV
jgi:hypothetical protein